MQFGNLNRWLGRGSSRTIRNKHYRRPKYLRPVLEQLEERVLLSTLLVNNPLDIAVTGETSLRQAVATANSDAAAGISDTIAFTPGLFDPSQGSTQTIQLTQGVFELSGAGTGVITIDGSSPSMPFTLNGGYGNAVFQVDAGVQAVFTNLTIEDGSVNTGNGGAILNNGSLTVSNTTFSYNNDYSGSGGAIENTGTLTVSNDIFSNYNYANNNGGAIDNSGTLTVTDSTFSNNYATNGGAIANAGTLIVSNSTFRSNSAGVSGGAIYSSAGSVIVTGGSFMNNNAGSGGAIENQAVMVVSGTTLSGNYGYTSSGAIDNNGTLTVNDATLSNNTTYGPGGGIGNAAGVLTVANSTFSGNRAYYSYSTSGPGVGGGIYNNSGALIVSGSTLTGNYANNDGGGIYTETGPLTVSNSTISGNNGQSGGGLDNNAGTLTLQDTIVAGNSYYYYSNPDIAGVITTDEGNNLLGTAVNNTTTIPSPGPNDVFSDSPNLSALGNYGGPTQTMALLPGSPAIGAGVADGVLTDQRGLPSMVNGSVDIGAFQTQSPAVAFTTLGQTLTAGQPATITVQLQDLDGNAAPAGSVNYSANGTTADASGTSNLTLVGGAGFAPGQNGQALSLNGVNQYAVTPNLESLFPNNDTSVTVSLWFNAAGPGVILDELGQPTPNSYAWHDSQIEILADGTLDVRVWNLSAVTLGTASFNAWHNVVLRYNQATQTLDGFLDGVQATTPVSGARQTPYTYYGYNSYGLYYAFGATDTTNLGSGAYFNGLVQNINIFDSALSNAEVQTLYSGGGSGAVTVTLGSSSSGGSFSYPDGVPIRGGQVVLPPGATSFTFDYNDTQPGTPSLTASVPGSVTATQQENVLPAPVSDTPSTDIVVGRTLSSYTTAGIQNGQETITYTVYNESADPLTGVLLTDTLEPGVTFVSASQSPDQSGQNLAWSLGTIEGDYWTSVTVTVSLANANILQLDTGARAYATRNAGPISASTPAATLIQGAVDPNLLASTPDANTTDPYVQEEAAALSYNAQNIFNFLQQNIGYNSYDGSLRGARGTLWSDAGNALDVASLGVALMRASGIPAQYVQGTLTYQQAQTLILSMFPASDQTLGYVPAGTQTSNPANDYQLLNETEQHYWFQFNTGSGWVNADPLMAGAQVGQAFTAATGTFVEVPQSLRQTTEVSLTAEIYSQIGAAFGLNPLQDTDVLDLTFNDVDLVGRPLTVGNLVSQNVLGGLIFVVTTNTYSPYLEIGDEANPDPSQHELITGQNYQEMLTNFPLGSQILTGLFLNLTLNDPQSGSQTYTSTLFDRIGYAARQGLAQPSNLAVSPTDPPGISPLDLTTLNILPGWQDPGAAYLAQEEAVQEVASISAEANPTVVAQANAVIAIATARLANFAVASDQETANLERGYSVVAYFAAPRITAFSSQVVTSNGQGTVTFNFDLVHDTIEAIAAPGQNVTAPLAFAAARGLFDSCLEAQVISNAPGVQQLSSVAILQMAAQQGIPLALITASNLAQLQRFNLPPDAIARITTNVQNGLAVIVPTQPLMVNGTPTSAWINVNPTTGEMIAESENGLHQDSIEYSVVVSKNFTWPAIFWNFQTPLGWVIIVLPGSPAAVLAKTLAAIFFGLAGGLSFIPLGNGWKDAFKIIAAILAALRAFGDPPLPPAIIDPNLPFVGSGAQASTPLAAPANQPAGQAAGTVETSSTLASGALTAAWASGATSSFLASSLGASAASVVNSQGTSLGSGAVALTTTAPTAVSISGSAQYSVNGQGTLAFYAPAESSLGVSGQWDSYAATVTGSVLLTLTVPADALTINGVALPAGTYTITTSFASLAGSGLTTSPNFAGSADLTATNGTVNLGPGSGTFSAGGTAIDPTNGITLDGYTGNITVAAGGGNNPDTVTLTGNTTNVLAVSATSATFTTDQNTPITFQANLTTSLADNYTLTAQAPAGWTVTIDSTGTVTVTPAPGLQGGTYPIQLVAQSASDPALVAQSTVYVTLTPTQPGLTLNVASDPVFTVPYNGAEVPTAFQASIQNLGPAADTYNLTFANVPSGFTLVSSATSLTVPAGQTGITGVYLVPITGSALPAPGTPLSFQVTATSTTNPALTQTITESFVMPVIQAVTIASNPVEIATLPGFPGSATVTLENVGNVPASAAVDFTTESGLTVSGLPAAPVAIGIGQSVTETVILAPDVNIPLNTTLEATVSVGTAAAQDDVSVLSISPSLADPVAGQTVDVSANVFAGVSNPRQADVSYTVTNGSGSTVFTSTPEAFNLGALPQAQTLDLGTFSTAGLLAGQYTINVTVTETNGQPIPGASGTGTIVVDSPLSADLTLGVDSVNPDSNFPVANTLTLTSQALVGSVPTDGTAATVALNGTLAYVAGTQDINIVDVSNPASPQVVGTFATGDLNGGGLVQVSGNELIVATAIANTVASSNPNSFNLLIYSLANPLAPQLVSTTTIPYMFPSEMVVEGNTVYIPTAGVGFDGNGDVSDQFGTFLAIDISNPAAPALSGVLSNSRGTPDGGSTAQHDVVPINSSVAYVVGSSSTGSATQMGYGQVLIVNTADPTNLTVAGTLDIPGTVDAQAMAVDGNYALVVGSTGGPLSQYSDPSQVGLSGNVTLTLVDISNPLQPTVVGSTLVTHYAFASAGLNPAGQVQVVDLGNGHFAVSDITLTGQRVILGVDASNPSSLVTSTLYAPANGLTVGGGYVYVAGGPGLQVYQAAALFNQAVTVQVVVPSGATITPNTFSVKPTQIVQGANFETLIWNVNLAPGASEQLIWLSTVNNLQPGQVQPMVSGATIQFADLGTNQQITLPSQAVGETPVTQSVTIPVQVVVPGVSAIAGAAVAAQQIANTNPTSQLYANLANQLNLLAGALTSLVQTPTSAVYQSEAVASLTSIISLVSNDPFLAPYAAALSAGSAAIASATTSAAVDTAVINLGTALDSLGQAISDEAAYGFTLSLTDPDAVIEPGVPTTYTIQMVNTGSATATYDFSVSGLPAGVAATFSQPSITLTSGEQIPEGTNTVTLSLSESGDTLIPADFTVTATAEEAPEITQGTSGQLDLRPESLLVGSVTTNPPFTNAGGQVDVTAAIESVVNEPKQVSVSYVVTDVNGNVLYTDTAPVSVSLGITSTLTTVDLGTFDTTGFVNGEDTITVTVTDLSSQPLPSATGVGNVTIGLPVTATLSVSPTVVPTGTATVGNTLQISSSVPLPAPLTLVGSVATTPAYTVAVYQDTIDNLTLAYVSGPNGIDIVNVTDPTNPVDLGTFAQNQIVQGGITVGRLDNINGTEYLLVATTTGTNANQFTLLDYSLASPLTPTLVNGPSGTAIPYEFINDFQVSGTTVIATTEGYEFFFGFFFIGQLGTVLSIDVSNPAAPVLEGVLYNDQGAPDGGDSPQYGAVIFNDQIAYVASTTSTGGDTTDGVGQVLVVNFSDPSDLTATAVQIPGTYQLAAVGLQGNQALVIGRTGGNGNAGVNGTMTLSVLDTTDPANPQLVGTTLDTNAQFASGDPLLSPVALGNGLFAVSGGVVNGQGVLLVVDTNDPNNILVSYLSVTSAPNEMAIMGDELFVVSAQGLSIFDVGQFEAIPVTASVEVPNNTGVAIVPSSLSVSVPGGFYSATAPQIVPGTNYDTITWSGLLISGASNADITWQSTVSNITAGEVIPVTLGASVGFVSQGTPGTVDVPGTAVTGVPFINLIPESQTVQPGSIATYDVQLTNPTDATANYYVFLDYGNNDYFYNVKINSDYYEAYVTVAPGATVDVPLQMTESTYAPAGDETFTVEARDAYNYYGGADGTTPGDLIVAGPPLQTAQPDPTSYGVVAALTPSQATAGQGTSAQYVVQVTNTGSAEDYYSFQVNGLPSGVYYSLGQYYVDVQPGAGNFVDVPLTLYVDQGTTTGSYPFTVTASSYNSSSDTSTVNGTLAVVDEGVNVSLDQSSAPPGYTFQMTVTNTGNVQDTYNLTLGGPAAAVASLGMTTVTLAPGDSEVIPITTEAVNFADAGSLELDAIATSQTDPAVTSEATASLVIPTSQGVTAQFSPASQTLTAPGTSSFTLLVNNIGNVQDSYTATIIGITGPVTANLVGLDGQPTQTVPVFFLPGLSEGGILLQTDTTGTGTDTITVVVTSLTNPAITTTATAIIKFGQQTAATTTTVTSDHPSGSTYGQTDTFTATVSSSETPSGTVQFQIDGSNFGSPVSLVNGMASVSTAALSAGSHTIDAFYTSDSSNFSNSDDSATPLSEAVSPASLIVTADNKSMTYGGSVPALTFTYTGLVNNDNSASFSGALTTIATSSSSVNSYAITEGSLAATGNYTIGTFNQGTLTVNPAPLIVTAANKTMTYGGNVPALTFTYTGLVNNDSSASFTGALTTTATSSSAVNSYAISEGSLAATGNYTIGTFNQGTLTVNPAPLIVTAANKTMTYGGSVPALTFTYTGLVNSDSSASFTGALATTATSSSPVNSYPITEGSLAATGNYAIGTFHAGTLTVSLPSQAADYILNPTANGALTASGNAVVKVPGGLYVDSSSASAVSASGNAQVNAGNPLLVVGGVSTSGNAVATKTGTPSFTGDPLASLAAPGVTGSPVSINLSGHQSQTINPGVYSQIQVSGQASLTMNQGVYVIAGGGFTVSGGGSVINTGTGVTIYNAGSGYAYNPTTGVVSDSGTFGSISLSGNGTINLSAPTSGPYAGVLLFQSRGNSRPLSLSGNGATGLTGIVYAPAAAAGLSGNAQLTGTFIVNTLSVSGNAGAFELVDGANSDYAVSTSNWISNGILTVSAEDDTGNGLDPNEIARISDAMTYLNSALSSFGVYLSWAEPGSSADVTIHFASSTPEGGAGDGVMGFTTATNDVYFVTGWSYYTGSDSSAIGAGQYDFLTLATHELAHTVGLGESVDPSSVLYEYLAPGTVRRTFTDSNLSLIDTNADRFMKAALVAPHGSRDSGNPASALSAPLAVALDRALNAAVTSAPFGTIPAALADETGSFGWTPALSAASDSQTNDHAAATPGLAGDGTVLVGGPGTDLVVGGQGQNLMVGSLARAMAVDTTPNHGALEDTVQVGNGSAGTRHAGSDLDWFFAEYAKDNLNFESNDLLRWNS